MARPLARSTVAVAAARPQSRGWFFLVVSLFVLAAAIAVFVFARNAAPRHAAANPGQNLVACADRPSQAWTLIAPLPTLPVQQATDRPAPTKAATRHEPDWSALSLGVADAQAAVAVPRTGGEAASPAELTVALSSDERARLIAAARDVESGPAPANYHPLLGALVPAGSGDGICR